MKVAIRLALLTTVALMASCDGEQSAINPQGPQASRIALMWWIILAASAAIFTAVTALALNAARRATDDKPRLSERQGWWLVGVGGVVLPTVVLFAFLIYSVIVGNANATIPPGDPVVIEAIGYQWWWDFHYRNEDNPSLGIRISNEIHIPVGKPVRLHLKSMDVIHSFWIPNLQGKLDMVPGQTNSTWVQADQAGVYRGQCAEFCGLQHSLMGFVVIAEPEEQFQQWLELQRAPAIEPEDPSRRRGQEVFLTSSCGLCHTVRGTIARAQVAPDLTHIGSRRTLAAATTPNNRGHLAAWIVDPNGIKPGSRMPPSLLEPADMIALLDYLQGLH